MDATLPRDSIPIAQPSFDDKEEAALLQTIRSGWVGQGPRVLELETHLKKHFSSDHAFATSSGTAALHLAMEAVKRQGAKRVALPAFTFVATANVIELAGLQPLFVDIDADTFNVDVDQLLALNKRDVDALLLVHAFGRVLPMPAILDKAKACSWWVVEDAACAAGAKFAGQEAGSFGDISCFSLHPRKLVTSGEGGYMILNDKKLAEVCAALRNHGLDTSDDLIYPGFNYRLSDLQAAVALCQLEKLESFIRTREEQAAFYDKAFASMEELITPTKIKALEEGSRHTYQSYVARLHPKWLDANDAASVTKLAEKKRTIIEAALNQGVHLRGGYPCLPALSYYQARYHLKSSDFVQSRLAAAATLALPIFAGLSQPQQKRVVDVIKQNIKRLAD